MNNESTKLALNRAGIQELLEQSGYDNANPEEKAAFISGIRHREAFLLAEQEQVEPVGEVIIYTGDGMPCAPFKQVKWCDGMMPPEGTKLYTTPQQRTWVGLTDEEAVVLMKQTRHLTIGGLLAIEAKLKEKNT